MAITAQQVQELYIAYLGRPADLAGLTYWLAELNAEPPVLTLENLRANFVNEQPEYQNIYGGLSTEQTVAKIYENLFGREGEAEGIAYWVSQVDSGAVNVDQLLVAFLNAASEADRAVVDQKVEDAMGQLPTDPEEPGEPGNQGETFTLTQRADNLQGADGVDTTFTAPVTQNETGSGALANTFETGDVLDGGADSTNVLRADLIASGSIGMGGFQSPAISAETTNIQEVYFRAQNVQGFDLGSNTTAVATIDAEKMVGVEQWWTDNSRADIRIEDVRSRPTDTILGMRNTDPEVGFEVYFNPLFMDGGQSSQSQLVIQIAELDGGVVNTAAELANISVNALSFELDGDAITISSDAMAEANTWEELEAAIVAALAEEGLGDLQVTRGDEGQFLLFDAEGRPFSNQGGFTASATTDQQIDIRNRITQDLQTEDEQTETTLVLDGAGNGSRGGDVNIAAMSGGRGVEVFNVQVDRDSHIRSLRSENNPNNTGSYAQEQQLEEVYLTHVEGGAQGAFQLGSRTVEQSGVSTTTDDRLVTDGLLDVRVFDAAGYAADIKLGASLTEAVFDKYLADAEETVQFSYLLGDGNNNLSLEVDDDVASDPDFALEIVGGAGDDRINLTGLQYKNSTSIDGAEGSNIVEVDTTTGAAAGGNTAAENSWASFENIQTLVVAGNNNTTQNLVVGNMGSLEQVVIATGNVDTNVQQMRMDQDLTISGKNQTLGAGNSNQDQDFGIVTINNTSAVPGVDSFEVLLDNTARVDGVLTVGNLVIDGVGNEITTLNLESAGRRDTANVVTNFNGADVTNLNLVGTQDLSIHVATIAAGATVDAVVDGSALTGDLVLAVNGAELDGGADDELIGTAGAADVLALYNNVTTNTDVSGFETVQFGWLAGSALDTVFPAPIAAAGVFDAANTTGVNTYIVGNLGAAAAFGIDSLRSGNVIQLGDATVNPGVVNQNIDNGGVLDLTFTGAGTTAQADLTINALSELDDLQFETGELTVNVNNFTNVTMDFDRSDSTAAENLFFTAVLDDDARTLTLTGGNADEDISLTQEGELNTSLTRIDISGFEGEVDLGVWDSLQGTNATIVVNGYNFTFDVGGDNTVVAVPAAGGAGNVAEVNTVSFAAAANALDIGESITITFAGSSYTFTNTTAAAINAANLNAAIIADATNAPAGFNIADNGAGLIQLTATTFGDLTGAGLAPVVTTTDADLGAPAVALVTAGDTTSVTGFDMVTVAPEFITSFDFNTDANDVGVVWQIDNFYAFEAGANVGLNNQSIIDLRDLGVNSATDIVVEDAATFWAGLTAAEQADFNFVYGADFGATFGAADTVITSNEGLNFTIVLTGVAVADVVNENIAGIA